MHVFVRDGLLKFFPQGRIDSENADKVEGEIFEEIAKYPDHEVAFDFRDLDYISSAGLRILLRVRKRKKTDLEIVNVSDTVYDVFEVTRFTDAFKISRKMRSINPDSREAVIRSLNGAIYLYGDDNMVKVFNKDVSMDEIKKERDSARAAMIAGVPTLIPFDIVTVGDNYGIIYESAGNTTLAETIRLDPGRLPDLARKFAAFLNEIHEIEADEFPDIKDRYREWLNIAGDRLPENDRRNITTLLDGIPNSRRFIHGNINPSNIIVDGDELMLMDMSGAAHGHPIFDLQALYASLVEVEKDRPMYCSSVFKMSYENCKEFWQIFFDEYMKDRTEEETAKMELLLQKYYVLKQKLLMIIES